MKDDLQNYVIIFINTNEMILMLNKVKCLEEILITVDVCNLELKVDKLSYHSLLK